MKEKEAETYLVLLRLGPQPVSVIAKKITINRSSSYHILENLLKEGFVEKVILENSTLFRAVNPEHLLDQFKTKQNELESKIENLESALKEFHKIKNGQEIKPKIIFFQDENGIQNMIDDTFSSTELIRCYSALDELSEMLPSYMPKYYEKRVKIGLKVRAIFPASTTSYLHKKRDKFELRESRLIPEDFNFHLDIMIYENKVVITSLKEKFGVQIESKQMAEAQKKIFDLIWESSKSYDQKITKQFDQKLRNKAQTDKIS